ncbi:MAG: TetR family transcriptional regulator [Pseudonocardia sp.]
MVEPEGDVTDVTDATDATDAEVAALARRLREARIRRGLTLRALAREIGVSPATLSHIETGKRRPSTGRLDEITTVLGLALDEPAPRSTPPPAPPVDWRRYPPLRFDPVLAAAVELFVEVGYHGASVRDIAGRCGLSVSGIYHHHPSKQQMLARILDLAMAELHERAELARAQGRDPVERFGLLVEHLALWHTRRRELGFIGASEMRSLDATNRPRIAGQRMRLQRMLDDEVDAAVALGRFGCRLPHEASRAVVTMCTSLVQWFRPDGPLHPEEIAAEYVEFALALMIHRPAARP